MPTLTPGELEVMQVLWDRGPLKPAEIQRNFPRPINNATLRSALRVLLEKGHVARQKEGKVYIYKAKTPRKNALKKLTGRLAEAFSGGSSGALIVQLIENEKLSPEDIAELQKIVRRRKPQKGTEDKGGK